MGQKKKPQPCKVRCKRVCTGAAEDGCKYCRACRAYRRAAERRYFEAHPDWYRAYCRRQRKAYRKRHPKKHAETNRRFAIRYHRSMAPKAIAYRERHRPAKVRATAKWVSRNPERKALQGRLNQSVARGDIVKPPTCQDCSEPKNPIVAWGLAEDDDGLRVERWLCWSCWWRRKRAQEGRE